MNENLEEDKKKSNNSSNEKNKDNIEKDFKFRKNYKVPDANNKKGFEKINIYNFIGITKFITFAEISEILFVNQKFYNIISQRYINRIPMIKTSIITLKKNIFLKFPEDFRFYLSKNSFHIRELIRKITESLVTEYFPNLGIKRYFFRKINFNSHINKIFLDNCDIGKKSMKYLSFYLYNPNCEIKDINISENKLMGEILEPIKSNQQVEFNSIIADKCIIDSKTLSILSSIKTKKLSLNSNNIDNELLSKLKNDYINDLNLSNNFISNNGILNLCRNIPNLTKLNLSHNNICDLSIVYICLYFKRPNNKLVSLNLKDNKITISGMITLISTLDYINKEGKNKTSIRKVNLSGNLLDYVPIPKRLGTNFLNVSLEKLCLSNHSFNINDLNILFNFINNIKNLLILDLSKTVFDNVSLNLVFNRVAENTSLKKLKLQNCYLGNTEVNNTLETYYSKSIKNKNKEDLNDADLNIIKKEEKNSNIIEENKFNINNEYLGVESLDLGNNFINYEKLDKIILSNHIKELNIEGNDLHLWGKDLYLFFDFILENKILEKINLDKNNLRKMGNKLLEKMYNYNSNNNSSCTLKYLSLEDNQINEINFELTNLLSNNKNLIKLNLKNNLIADEISNNYFFHSLFKNKDSNIEEIDLSNNKISLEFVDKIIKYSKENNIEKNNFILNITSKEIRETYLKLNDKKRYWELIKLNCIKCF